MSLLLDVIVGLAVAVSFVHLYNRIRGRAIIHRHVRAYMVQVGHDSWMARGAALAYGDVRLALKRARELGLDPDTVMRRVELYASSREAHYVGKQEALLKDAERRARVKDDDGA